jgi:hypothetical protein
MSVYVWRSGLSLSVSNLTESMAIVHETTKENPPPCAVHGVFCARYSASLAFRRPDCAKNTCVLLSGRSPVGGPAVPGPLSLAFLTQCRRLAQP